MAKKSYQNKLWTTALLYVLVGILLCMFRTSVLNWAMTAIGAVLILMGIVQIAGKSMVEGIITAAIGVVIVFGGWLFVDIILLVLGVSLCVKGLLELGKELEHKKKHTAPIVSACITLLVGVMLVVSKWMLLDWFFIVIGVVLICDGVTLLLGKK